MGNEPISTSPSEVKTLTEINISQSTPIEEKENPGYISNKSMDNATQDTVSSPDVLMR